MLFNERFVSISVQGSPISNLLIDHINVRTFINLFYFLFYNHYYQAETPKSSITVSIERTKGSAIL